MKIAVVIPCWNEAETLPKMLDSLIAQRFQDWHAFCVDDQSTDNTAQVLQSYQAKDSRIEYVRRERPPKGGQTCRNTGLDLAKDAEYVCLFDADDAVAPYCFEQRVAFMDTHPEVECGVFPMMAYKRTLHEEGSPVYGIQSFEDDLEAMLYLALPMAISTNTYRTSALQKYGIVCDENLTSLQDSDLTFQVLLSGMNYAYAKEAKADYFYHITNDGVASTIVAKSKWKSNVYLMQKVAESVEAKYGNRYDQQLAIYYALIIRKIGINQDACPSLMQLPWMRRHTVFRLRTALYQFTRVEKLWGAFFFPYRQKENRYSAEWRRKMAEERLKLTVKSE